MYLYHGRIEAGDRLLCHLVRRFDRSTLFPLLSPFLLIFLFRTFFYPSSFRFVTDIYRVYRRQKGTIDRINVITRSCKIRARRGKTGVKVDRESRKSGNFTKR